MNGDNQMHPEWFFRRVQKRGQLTIFIMIAIVIIVILLFIFLNPFNKEDNNKKEDNYFVKDLFVDCAEVSVDDALELISIQGGYFKRPVNSYDLGWAYLTFFYFNGSNFVPSLNVIEDEIEEYLDKMSFFCFDKIKMEDLKINYSLKESSVRVEKDKILFLFDLEVYLDDFENTYTLELNDLLVERDSKLFDFVEISNFIVEDYIDNEGLLCANCIDEFSSQREIFVDITSFYEEESNMVILIENVTSNDLNYFQFLIKRD